MTFLLFLPDEPEKISHFRKFIASRVLHIMNQNCSYRKSKYFCDVSRCLKSNGNICKLNFSNFNGCNMIEKEPKTLIKS